jgi:proliferating cell nuclear antigen
MFECRFAQAVTLRKILDAIKDLVTQTNLEVSDGGIAIQAMDTTHISLVALQLRDDGFETFRCDNNVTLGLNVNILTKILKCAANDDSVTLRAHDEGDHLHVIFKSPTSSRVSEFELKLMDIDEDPIRIPPTEYSATVEMPSVAFQRICRDLLQFGDSVSIAADKDGVRFSVKGQMANATTLLGPDEVLDGEEGEAVRVSIKQPVELAFALKYLINFAKASPLSPTVKLQLAPQIPLSLTYAIESLGYVTYFLAPKIETEEESTAED